MLRVAREIAETPFISRIVNSSINAPRDRLLRSSGYLNVDNARSLYATPHRMFNEDWRSILMFAFGTIIVYFPLAVVLALLRMRRNSKVQVATGIPPPTPRQRELARVGGASRPLQTRAKRFATVRAATSAPRSRHRELVVRDLGGRSAPRLHRSMVIGS
jgi:hypothetical protein